MGGQGISTIIMAIYRGNDGMVIEVHSIHDIKKAYEELMEYFDYIEVYKGKVLAHKCGECFGIGIIDGLLEE